MGARRELSFYERAQSIDTRWRIGRERYEKAVLHRMVFNVVDEYKLLAIDKYPTKQQQY